MQPWDDEMTSGRDRYVRVPVVVGKHSPDRRCRVVRGDRSLASPKATGDSPLLDGSSCAGCPVYRAVSRYQTAGPEKMSNLTIG